MAPSPAAVAWASRRWARSYPLAPRYQPPALALRLRSADGTRLSAVWVPGPADAIAAIVVVHGFSNRARSWEVHAAVDQLSKWAHVVAVDLRGHGGSAGRSTFGLAEPADVAAAVTAGRVLAPGLPVVALGLSLGGASALFAAGGDSPLVGVIAISAPARPDLTSPAGVRLARWTATRRGRALILALSGTKVDPAAGEPGDLRSAVAAIAPGFVVIAHDPHEPVFGPEHAEALFAWAGEPKALWWVPGGGHGRSMLTPDLLERVRVEVSERLGRSPAPRR